MEMPIQPRRMATTSAGRGDMTTEFVRGGKRVTLDDVARRAGVSRALVSIVMRDVPGASAATRRRVLATAQELGYRPDARARSLAGNSSKLIGVLFDTASAYHFSLLDGLYSAAGEFGYSLLLSALTDTRDERRAVQSLSDFQFDGLIMLGPSVAHPVLSGQLPVVVVGWTVDEPDVDSVHTSDTTALNLAVDFLAGLGHRRIAHIDGGDSLISSSRRRAYLAAMDRRGLGRSSRVIAGGETQLAGQRAAHELLRHSRALPTALVCFNDETAVAAMGVLQQHGIDIPGQVSMIGYDDNKIARERGIDLTSIAQQPRELARLAVERLHDRLLGKEILGREIVLEPTLTMRSTAAAAPASRTKK